MAEGGAAPARVATEEVRFAVVLNGGVSLAVWMGGVVHEIDAATQGYDGSEPRPTHAYGRLMDELRIRARADVITGTSAGGINGAALALAQVNRGAKVMLLRDLWAEQGRMETLLQRPFSGQPASLLRGEEYFLPKLVDAMTALTANWDARDADERPVDLTITATLLSGALQLSTDSTGAVLPQRRHDGHFRFQRGLDDETRDDFDIKADEDVARRLGLAARCSAGFPGAFEPTYVPVGRTVAGRPSVSRKVANWGGFVPRGEDRDLSRFAVDGGVLANTPTKQALDAIQNMKASSEVQRVMLLIYPHAPSDVTDAPDEPDERPPLSSSLVSLLTALRADGGRTHVERIEEHNRRAASRRTTRAEILRGRDDGNPLLDFLSLSDELYFVYRRQRIVRAARDLPQRIDLPAGWSFERTRAACQLAQEQRPDVPYAPIRPNFASLPPDLWNWGASAALDLADIALEVTDELRRVGHDPGAVNAAVHAIHIAMAEIRAVRRALDGKWQGGPGQRPDTDYWRKRLDGYDAYMCQPGSEGGVPTATAVGAIVDALLGLEPWVALASVTKADPGWPWQNLFGDFEQVDAGDRRRTLFSRLLRLHVVSWCVGDEFTENNTRPIELVQVSAQTHNAFAQYSRSMEDKLGSETVGRFGGFLRASWRMNDWAWGRLDGATHLFRVLLTPARVQAYVARHHAEEGTVEAVVRRLARLVFGTAGPPSELAHLVTSSVEEVRRLFEGSDGKSEPEGALRPKPVVEAEPLVHLPQLLTYARHAESIVEDLPAVASAVRVDQSDGAGERFAGARLVAERSDLLSRVQGVLRGDEPDADKRLRTGLEALAAFDQAGIGRERSPEVASSDQMIRTAVTGAAVATTLIDSPASGFGKLKPVTKLARGLMMLPYWITLGLTSSGTIARGLAALGLAGGGAALALALLGVVPLSSVWAVAGAGVLLFAFAYASARTGSTLHSFAFLTGALIALAIGVTHGDDVSGSRTSAAIAVVAVIVGVVVLGSIPNPLLSPTSLIAGLRPVPTVVTVLGLTGAAIAAYVVSWTSLRKDLEEWWGDQMSPEWWPPAPVWLIALVAGLLLLAAWLVAHLMTSTLSQVVWQPVGDDGTWERQLISHPASLFAAWSCVYGVLYLAAAVVLALGGWVGDGWVALLAVIGVVFTAVAPAVVTGRARSNIVRHARRSVTTDVKALRPSQQLQGRSEFGRWLIIRGWGLAFLIAKDHAGVEPTLTERGVKLYEELRTANPPGPVVTAPPA